MKIIGIGGTNGAGKDVLSELLASDFGWLFVSASGDLIIPGLKELGLPLEREQMAALTTRWREDLGMGAVVDKAVELYKNQPEKFKGLVISSLRHPGEADRVHELGGKVIWIDADPKIRYERIFKRGQGSKDQKTFEQFQAEEAAEMHHSGSEATLSVADVKDRADIIITNDTNDIGNLKRLAEEKLDVN